MFEILPDESERFVRAMVGEHDETLTEMEAHGDDIGFPTVGPEVGAFLRLVTRMVDARRVFEFGSGFGYSAYWFAQALPEDGEVVLTETDADELERAREYLSEGGYADRATFEEGDALAIADRYDGPFDVVLIDCHKSGYPDALDAIRDEVAEGGVVVADNAMVSGGQDFEAIRSILEGDDPEGVDEGSRGVADYLLEVRDSDAFETVAVPLGQGVTVSYKR